MQLLQDDLATMDYGASEDPATLLSQADLVVRGRLMDVVPIASSPLLGSVGLKLRSLSVPQPTDRQSDAVDPVFTVRYNPSVHDDQDDVDLIPTGAEVIILASGSESQDVFSVLIEGFWIECESGSGPMLVGQTASGAGWPELTSLDDLESLLIAP